jgi:hypothetical protein
MHFEFGKYDIRSCGLIGTILYSLFSAICLWRAIYVKMQIGSWNNMKVHFHFILLINGLLEVAYFILMLVNNSYTCIGYSFHLLSMLCDVMAFGVVTYMWSTTVAYKNHANRSFYVVSGFTAINVVCVFFAMVDLGE